MQSYLASGKTEWACVSSLRLTRHNGPPARRLIPMTALVRKRRGIPLLALHFGYGKPVCPHRFFDPVNNFYLPVPTAVPSERYPVAVGAVFRYPVAVGAR